MHLFRCLPSILITFFFVFVSFPLVAHSSLLLDNFGDNNPCGPFQFYNASFDKDDIPPVLQTALQQVDEYLEMMTQKLNLPSLSFGIVYDQQLIHYKAIGKTTNMQSKGATTTTTPTPDSIYRIGSVSKVWTVLMIYALRDRKLLSMDDPISKFYPDFTIHNPWGITAEEKEGKTITIQHLASQISGLPRTTPCSFLTTDCTNITTKEIMKRLSQQSLIHPTDVQSSYSNLAYAILGNVVLTEYNGYSSYNETLFDLLLTPLGLNHTGLYLTDAQKEFAATGYQPDGTETDYIDLGWEGPAGQIFSSVNDLSILLQQFFAAYPSLFQQDITPPPLSSPSSSLHENGFVVTPQSLREMLRPVFANPDQQSAFGAPWEMQWLPNGSGEHLVRSKGGGVNGFSAHISIIPEMKVGMIALTNTLLDINPLTFNPMSILTPPMEAWMQEMKTTNFQPPVPSNIGDYVGEYAMAELPIEIHVSIDETATRAHELLFMNIPGWISGWLIWKQAKKDEFVLSDSSPHLDMCWSKTLLAADGCTVRFGRHNGHVVELEIEGLLYDLPFGKNTFHLRKRASGVDTTVLDQSLHPFPLWQTDASGSSV